MSSTYPGRTSPHLPLLAKIRAEIRAQLVALGITGGGVAPIDHTHTEYAPVEHDHAGYSAVGHTHTEYAPVEHEHPDYENVPVADATTTTKGVVQLAGDLGGTAAAPTVDGLRELRGFGALDNNADLNGVLIAGSYWVAPSRNVVSAPAAIVFGVSANVEVLVASEGNNVTQRIVKGDDGRTWTRVMTKNTGTGQNQWSSWRELSYSDHSHAYIPAADVTAIDMLTDQAAYDAIPVKSATTLYLIPEETA